MLLQKCASDLQMPPYPPSRHHHEAPSGQPAEVDIRDNGLRPSRLAVNSYLLLGIAALTLSSRPQVSSVARYAIGIGVEMSLAILALVFARLERLPLRVTMRLRRPDRQTLWMALGAVPGLWILGVALNLFSRLVLGYTTPAPPAQYPANGLEALLLALTAVLVAPICEELMFRGYVQRAYERPRGWIGAIVGAIIFAAYHLRFQGLFGLMPIALGLGLIAWRTESVYPSMLMHASFNAIATGLLISTSLLPMQGVAAVAGMLFCLAVLMVPLSLATLWLLWRTTSPGTVTADVTAHRGVAGLAWIAPLMVLLGVYTYASISEILLNRHPETVLHSKLTLETDDTWLHPVSWHYRIEDLLGHERGQAICTRAYVPSSQQITLDCQASHTGFDLTAGIGGLSELSGHVLAQWLPQFSGRLGVALEAEPTTWTLSTAWTQPTLQLCGLVAHEERGEDRFRLEYTQSEDEHVLSLDRPGGQLTLIELFTKGSLISREWAWRGSGLAFQLPYGSHVRLLRTNEKDATSWGQAFLQIVSGEPVWTPAGNYVTWRVNLSWRDAKGFERLESAWYDADAPHTLVRYDDGSVRYVLTGVEAADQS